MNNGSKSSQTISAFNQTKCFGRNCRFSCSISSGSSCRVRGGARNMKSMRPPSAAIFFMTYFHRARGRGHGPLGPPWIRYCLLIFSVRLCGKERLLLMESFKSVVMIQQGTNFVMITQMRVRQISLPYLMYHLLFYLWYKYIQFVIH